MGKNYIESSLKRFLKRKVKITLGVVVTFLITGMVSLGAHIRGCGYFFNYWNGFIGSR